MPQYYPKIAPTAQHLSIPSLPWCSPEEYFTAQNAVDSLGTLKLLQNVGVYPQSTLLVASSTIDFFLLGSVRYKSAMTNLDVLSNEIHETREAKKTERQVPSSIPRVSPAAVAAQAPTEPQRA